tara:strand:- start:189 stop:1133 length:945 start_codon:yes stop_codon:yes gene_type:complete
MKKRISIENEKNANLLISYFNKNPEFEKIFFNKYNKRSRLNLTDTTMGPLSKKNKINSFTKKGDFSFTIIKDDILKILINLTHINLSYCEYITDEGLYNLPKTITHINLKGCTQITDTGLANLPKTVTNINLENECWGSKGPQITDAGLAYLKNVITINLKGNSQITNDGLKHLENVKEIDLSGCKKITDAGLAHLKKVEKLNGYLTNLGLSKISKDTVDIDLIGNNNITDKGLIHIENCKKIKLFYCPKITNAGLSHLKSVIDISLPCQITDTGLNNLNLKKVKTIRLRTFDTKTSVEKRIELRQKGTKVILC